MITIGLKNLIDAFMYVKFLLTSGRNTLYYGWNWNKTKQTVSSCSPLFCSYHPFPSKAMVNKPLVLKEEDSWDKWIVRFEHKMSVNNWNNKENLKVSGSVSTCLTVNGLQDRTQFQACYAQLFLIFSGAAVSLQTIFGGYEAG